MFNAARRSNKTFPKTRLALAISALVSPALLPYQALAAPTGGVVTTGAANIIQSGNITDINQSTHKATINWHSFSTAASETVNFNQPNVASVTLNRVIGNEQSVLNGALNANGQVFLLNSNGVLIGKGASVNTAGFVASTLGLSDADFNNGHYRFNANAPANGSPGALINLGTIISKDGGYAALLGQSVSNQGVIVANKGVISLNSGNRITLNFNGDSLLNVSIDEGALNALVENKQAIQADGGKVILTAKAAGELLNSQVNNTGTIQAQTLDDVTGSIELYAHGGTAAIRGTLDASAPTSGNGGFIETSGDTVKIADGATITTLAQNGQTGTWLIDPMDFTIGSGGDISGAQLSSNLASSNVKIESIKGKQEGNGDIHVNDAVSWDADTTLTLTAERDININNAMTVGGANGGLTLNAGGDYHIRTKASYSGTVLDANGKPVAKQDTSGGVYGSITFTNSANKYGLTINEQTYTLIHSMDELDALDKIDGVTNLFEDGTPAGTKVATVPLPTENIVRKNIKLSGGKYYDPVEGVEKTRSVDTGGSCAATTCFYNPETRQYDLTKEYSGKLLHYYEGKNGSANILAYDPQTQKYYNFATGQYELDALYPVFQGIYIDPVTGEKNYSFNGQKYYDPRTKTYHLDQRYDGRMHYNIATDAYDKFSIIYEGGQKLYYQPHTNTYAADRGDVPSTFYYNPIAGRFDLAAPYAAKGHYALAKNLDAGGTTYTTALVDAFDGTLTGLGHTINHLTIHSDRDKIGLIGTANADTTIRDIGLLDVDLVGASYVGSLLAYSQQDNIRISNSYSTGSVSGKSGTGGLVGRLISKNGLLENSFSTVNVRSSGSWVGGLIGYIQSVSLSRVHATGDIFVEPVPNTTPSSIGGLAGMANGGVGIDYSYATGNVLSNEKSSQAGGLVGYLSLGGIEPTYLANSYASGNVTGGHTLGGLLGSLSLSRHDVLVANVHASGDVTGLDGDNLGGLIGRANGLNLGRASLHIQNASAQGNVVAAGRFGDNLGGLVGVLAWASVSDSHATGNVRGGLYSMSVGGLVGSSRAKSSSVSRSYATGDVTGFSSVGGLVGGHGGLIRDSYATGAVTGIGSKTGNGQWIGDFLGYNGGVVENSYWRDSGVRDGLGVNRGDMTNSRGLTDEQMKDVAYYADGTIDQVLSARAALRTHMDNGNQQAGSLVRDVQFETTSASLLPKSLARALPDMDDQIRFIGGGDFSAQIQQLEAGGEMYELEDAKE